MKKMNCFLKRCEDLRHVTRSCDVPGLMGNEFLSAVFVERLQNYLLNKIIHSLSYINEKFSLYSFNIFSKTSNDNIDPQI